MMLHFDDLKRDLPGGIRRIAAFLGIALDEESFARILEHCSFDYMKAHADMAAPLGGKIFEGGGRSFIHKGTNGRWRDELPEAWSRLYEERALAELGPECAAWLRDGGARWASAA
jgi:aryl sulfotransferase